MSNRLPISITITGADDATDMRALLALAADNPFIELGVLWSPKNQGAPRYPTDQTICNLLDRAGPSVRVAVHFCGQATRDTIAGNRMHIDKWSAVGAVRIQLNGYDLEGDADLVRYSLVMLSRFARVPQGPPLILQARTPQAQREASFLARWHIRNATVLYDPSGGLGLESHWPSAYDGVSTGYAGGITPDNVADALSRCMLLGGDWIDMESGVRTDDRFDLDKVRAVIDRAKAFDAVMAKVQAPAFGGPR